MHNYSNQQTAKMDFRTDLTKKNNKGIKVLTALFALTLAPVVLFAQKGNTGKGEIEDTQIIIEKDKKIELPEAVRNFEKPSVQPKSQLRQVKPYQFDDFEASLSDIETKVKVLTAKEDELKKLYGNYLKVGYGSYGTSYLEGFFNNKRSQTGSYGARVKHLASRYGHVDNQHSGSSDNEVGLFGSYFSDYAIISGRVDYNRERYNFYGYPRYLDPKPTLGEIKQVFQTISGGIQFDNNQKDSNLDYHLGLSASRLVDYYSAVENEFGIKLNGGYTLASSSKILLSSQLFFTNRKDSASVNRSYFKLSPHYVFEYKGFLLKLGANIIYQNDTINTNKFLLLPSAEASYQLIPEVTAFAGVEGDVQRNTLKSFITENPYVEENVKLRNTTKLLDIYGGFRGKVGSNFAYNLKVSVADYKNLYFYLNNDNDQSIFNIQYGDRTTVLSYLAELGYAYSEKLTLGLKLEGFGYDLKDMEQHWHRPNYTGTFIGKYNLKEKISFTGELFYINGLIARIPNSGDPGNAQELDDVVDLNLKVDYRFSSKFSAFVHGNNLLGKNYQRYLYYPSRGFNILAGITFSL
jgi:hypothetical protein